MQSEYRKLQYFKINLIAINHARGLDYSLYILFPWNAQDKKTALILRETTGFLKTILFGLCI